MDLSKIIANSMYIMAAAFAVIVVFSIMFMSRGRKQRKALEERRRMAEQERRGQDQLHTVNLNSSANEFRTSKVVNPPAAARTTTPKPTSMADRLKVVNDKKK